MTKEFITKRIAEQAEYINQLMLKSISKERKKEIYKSAIGQLQYFQTQLPTIKLDDPMLQDFGYRGIPNINNVKEDRFTVGDVIMYNDGLYKSGPHKLVSKCSIIKGLYFAEDGRCCLVNALAYRKVENINN